jgi:hypothetical protein
MTTKNVIIDPQVHMTEVLEAALAELKDPKVKKIQKFL